MADSRDDQIAWMIAIEKQLKTTQRALANVVAMPGPPGPPGPGVEQYTHNQIYVSTTWTIVHNLGREPIAVRVFDGFGNELFGAHRVDIDNTTLTLSFAAPQDGSAVAG